MELIADTTAALIIVTDKQLKRGRTVNTINRKLNFYSLSHEQPFFHQASFKFIHSLLKGKENIWVSIIGLLGERYQ